MEQQINLGAFEVYNGPRYVREWVSEELYLNQKGDLKWLTLGQSRRQVYLKDDGAFNAYVIKNGDKCRFNIPTHIRQYVYGE